MCYISNKVYNLPEYIDKSKVKSRPVAPTTERFIAKYPFLPEHAGEKFVIVIMKNPSNSLLFVPDQEKTIDESTFNVLEFINSTQYKSYKGVYIINLFPCYATNAEDVNTIYGFRETSTNMDELNHPSIVKNFSCFVEVLNSLPDSDIIVAWGKNWNLYKQYYDEQIIRYLTMMIDSNRNILYVDNIGSSYVSFIKDTPKYPLHGWNWNQSNLTLLHPPH